MEAASRRRLLLGVGAGTAVVVLVVLVTVWRWGDGAGESITTTSEPAEPDSSVEPEPHADEVVLAEALEPMPLERRVEVAMVWTGREVVVWGGIARSGPVDQPTRVYSDGAALDMASGAWRVLPPSPFPELADQRPDEVDAPRGVMTDAGVVIVRDGVTAAWDPAADSWREMDPPPSGTGLLVSSGSAVFSVTADASLDVVTGRWRPLPDPPSGIGDSVAAWTGDELVVVVPAGAAPPVAHAYDPALGTWRTLPAVPASFSSLALSAGWDGGRVIVVDGDRRQTVAYDPATDRWDELPDTGMHGSLWWPVSVTSLEGHPVLFMRDVILVLDEGLWRPVPYGGVEDGTILDLSGGQAVRGPGDSTVLILSHDPDTGSQVVHPMEVLEVLRTRRIAVGPITLEVPERYSPSRVASWKDGALVSVHLQSGMDLCTVVAGHGFAFDGPIGSEVSVVHDDGTRTWIRHESGQSWRHRSDELDVSISCGSPAVTETLVRSVTVPREP